MIEDVEDNVDRLPHSDFSKSAMRVFDEIDHWKADVLPQSKFVDFIETLGVGFNNEELAGQLLKVDPNESGILYRFDFMRQYVDEEVSLDSTEEVGNLVGWVCKLSLMYIQ